VKETVTRFKDDVRYWEVWNDEDRYHDNGHHMPNGWVGNTDEYLELLRAASREIRAIDPGLHVLNGAFYTVRQDPRHELNPDMVPRVVREAQDSFDVLATLNDTHPKTVLGPLADLRKELASPKPLWVTRAEQRAATPDEVIRQLLGAKGCGANAFVWMWGLCFDSGWRGLWMPMNSFKTPQRKPINQHSFFQMMPAGCAYVHAIGLLRMLSPAGRIETGANGQWIFGFAATQAEGRRQVVGFWRDEPSPDAPARLRVGAGATCSLVDLFGNAEPLAVDADGAVSVTVRRRPAYLVVTGGDAVRAATGSLP
jgi:hypothetical protein